MSENKKNNDEEIDLGSLFIIIGRGLTKLFSFIGNIFKGIFHFLIECLLFLRKNLVILLIAGIIGAIVGFFLEKKSGTKYEANLTVRPNYNSSRQLYNNIKFYNDAIKEKDYSLLSSVFKISEEEAKSLRSFNIEPFTNENDIITAFDLLATQVDSITFKSYSYDKFNRSFTDYDYEVHKISVVATKNDVFQKLSIPIISSITNNEYFKNLKSSNNENLMRTVSLIQRNLKQADSLHSVYRKAILDKSKTTNSGTNINFEQKTREASSELQLFETTLVLNQNLVMVNHQLSEESKIINIISNFQPIGHKIKEIERNKTFQFSVIGIALTIMFLLIFKLNHYLKNYNIN